MDHDQCGRREFLGRAVGAAGASIAVSRGVAAAGREGPTPLAFRRDLPVDDPYDVIVCGGGPSGFAAAQSARRTGARVLLVEGQGQLGGNGVSGLVSHWLGGRTSDCRRWVVGGLFRSMAQEAASGEFALLPEYEAVKKYQPHGWHKGQLGAGIPFDPYAMAAYLDQKTADAEIDLRLFTQVVDVVVDRQRITHVVLFNKSGLRAVPARAVVDATGDADVAARSGCQLVRGRDSDGLMTPASLIFHVDNVDQDALDESIHAHSSPRFRKKIADLRAAGQWPFPYDIFICVQLVEKGTMMINTIRLVGVDGTDGESVTEGMIRGRAETSQLMDLMREHFPGFAEARLKTVAPVLGVRETRRIRGRYMLSVDDLREGRDFQDTIGFSAYGWDLPDPRRPSDNPSHGKKREITPIPYRTMIPQPIQNLICPGRAISVERPVLGPLRVTAPCMAMGEAAGQAAGIAVRERVSLGEVDSDALRRELQQYEAIVDWT